MNPDVTAEAGRASPREEGLAGLAVGEQHAAHLAVRGLHKEFESARGTVEALRDVSLEIPVGEFAAFVGPSGCGKSTLLRIITGIYPATSGVVTIGGERVTKPRRDVGLVFQSPNLLPWRTIEANVALPLEVGGRSGKEMKQEARARAD